MANSTAYTPSQRMENYAKGKKRVDLFGEMLDAPQKSAVYLTGNGYKKPSEAMGIKNKWGAIATDTALDPLNAVFFLKGGKMAKAAQEASKPKMVGGINLTNPRNAARVVNKAKKLKGASVTLDAQSVYSDIKSGAKKR